MRDKGMKKERSIKHSAHKPRQGFFFFFYANDIRRIVFLQPKLSQMQRDVEEQENTHSNLIDKKQLNLQRLVADQQKNKW